MTKFLNEESIDILETNTKTAHFSKRMKYTKNIIRENLELKDKMHLAEIEEVDTVPLLR